METGEYIPELLGTDEAGRELRRDDFAGRPFVLYFYPKDNTPGCTAEACSRNFFVVPVAINRPAEGFLSRRRIIIGGIMSLNQKICVILYA